MTALFASLNGERVVTASIDLPYWGLWSADVSLATSTSIPDAVTLTIGNLSLVGHSYRMASFAGSRSVRIVGGFGGWRKTIPAQGYASPQGIRKSLLLRDAAAACGEQVVIAQDETVGTTWAREEGPASNTLRALAGSLWWVNPVGVTQTGARPTSPITSSFEVINWSGSLGRFTIATETLQDWMPGRTFSSPTVPTSQTISLSSLVMNNDGTLRVEVLSAGAADLAA